MGAREELVAAAQALTARGQAPFSPAQLIAEARSNGSRYPDATLRSFVIGPMCVNSPNHHAVQYGDLERVGHGQYRLAGTSGAGPVGVGDPPAGSNPTWTRMGETPASGGHPTDEWGWEGNVQASVVRHLAVTGWDIRRVADTASRAPDPVEPEPG